jgi:riboflavin synthase
LFTGIIEEVGIIEELRMATEGATITVEAKAIAPGIKIGDSISVDGVCLTATRTGTTFFSCDISAETLRLSSFKQARPGSKVNLERSMMIGGRLGGHFVLGHVDAVGALHSKKPSGDGFEMSFEFPRQLERYLVYKGSIAVNGISLTISALERERFSVAVIPHTYAYTNLGELRTGGLVNLEVDVLGRYFERFFELGLTGGSSASKLTPEYLKEQGF